MAVVFFIACAVLFVRYINNFIFSSLGSLANFWDLIKDSFKKDLPSIIIGTVILMATNFLIYRYPMYWRLFFLLSIIFFLLLKGLFDIHLMDLFLLRFRQLADEKLFGAIARITNATGFSLNRIYILENQNGVNARASGAGKFARILLTEDLIQKLSDDEITAVIAHEIGHLHHHHQMKYLFLETLLITFFIGSIIHFMYFSHYESPYVVIALFPLAYFYLLPFLNGIKRHFEIEADQFALKHIKSELYKHTLTKIFTSHGLSSKSHPFYYFWYHSHPNPINRLKSTHD